MYSYPILYIAPFFLSSAKFWPVVSIKPSTTTFKFYLKVQCKIQQHRLLQYTFLASIFHHSSSVMETKHFTWKLRAKSPKQMLIQTKLCITFLMYGENTMCMTRCWTKNKAKSRFPVKFEMTGKKKDIPCES